MRISTRFYSTAALALVLVLAVSLVLRNGDREMDSARRKHEWSVDLLKQISSLSQLTSDYLLRPSAIARGHWLTVKTQLAAALARHPFTRPRRVAVVEEIRRRLQRMDNLFLDLSPVEEASAAAEGALEGLRRDKRRVLGSFLSLALHETTADVLYLHEVSDADTKQAEARVQKMVLSLVLTTSLVVLAVVFTLRRSVVGPLAKLRGGVATVATGNLGYRGRDPAQNELGDLSRAFDGMLDRLQEITVSHGELEARVQERTAQLEAANKELEAFAYSVSHDLRAPLRAVDGYTRILLEDYEPRLDAEGKRVCAVISESARGMGKLIDDLLAFSRVGRGALASSTVDMATLARSIFFELTTPEGRERIDFRVGPLPSAVGDPTLLRQVWTNLLSNALKFSAKKERAVIEVGAQPQGEEVVYTIRDNGVGFDMQYVGKLFGVFQRLHSTKEFEGTGVGLAIVQRILHRHGGRIWAEGETGKGAAFHFALGKGE